MGLAVPFVLALGGLFWVVGDTGDSSDDAVAPSSVEEQTVSTDREDPDGSAPGADTATPTTASVGVAAGDAVVPVDDQGRAIDPPGTPDAPGSAGPAGSPGSTTPPSGTNPNQPSWSSPTTTTRPTTSTTAPRPATTTTTTAPPGLLGGLLDALGLGLGN